MKKTPDSPQEQHRLDELNPNDIERDHIRSVLEQDSLSESEKTVLKEKFKAMLSRMYAGEREDLRSKSTIDIGMGIGNYIAEQVSDSHIYVYTQRYREACELFLKELIAMVLQKTKSISEQEQLKDFVAYCNQILFGYSPSIIDVLDLTIHFDLLTRASRTPLLNWLSTRLVQTLNYYMRFYPNEVREKFIIHLKNESTARQLDALHLLESIGIQVEGEGWAEGTSDLAVEIITEIQKSKISSFTHYAAACSTRSIEEEKQKIGSHPIQGRLIEEFSEADLQNSRNLKAKIELSEGNQNDGIIIPLSEDYIGIFDDSGLLQEIAKYQAKDNSEDSNKKVAINCKTIDEVTEDQELDPFQSIDSADIPLLLQQLHRPRMRAMVEKELGIELKEMPLANQLQLLRFMADEKTETFEQLRQVLPGEGNKRQHFLATFLACAKDRNYGHKILELAKLYPNEAEAIFERFYQIVSITRQEEAKLQKALTSDPILKNKANLTHLYRTILERGTELLADAYENINRVGDIDAYLQAAKRYQLKLIAFRGIFDAITNGDVPVTLEEIEQLTADEIKAEIIKGGRLLSFNPEHLSEDELQNRMWDENSYLNPAQFSQADYQMVVNNIRNTYKGMDEGWADYLVSRIPHHLANPDSHFILIRNEEGQLAGIGRSDKIAENHYYMGTFYVEDGYQGIGRYIGEYLKTELPPNAEIEGTTTPANPATSWHIEINGYVGHRIEKEGDSHPLIRCSNLPAKTFLTKNKEQFSQEVIKKMGTGDFEGGAIKVIKADTTAKKAPEYMNQLKTFLESQGYHITRFFYEDPKSQEPAANTWIVLEKIA